PQPLLAALRSDGAARGPGSLPDRTPGTMARHADPHLHRSDRGRRVAAVRRPPRLGVLGRRRVRTARIPRVGHGRHLRSGTAAGGVELLKQTDPRRYGSLELVPGDAADWPLLHARDLRSELGGGSLVDVLSNSAFTGGGDSSAFGVLIEEIYRTYAHSYDA